MPQYEFNLRDYWQIVQKRRLVLVIIFIAIVLSTIIYTDMQKPTYRATASVQLIERKTLGDILTQLVTVKTGDPLATQAMIITSLPVLEKVVVELGLGGEYAGTTAVMQEASRLQEAVSTDIVTGTNIIRINVTYGNPQIAADIANKIAEVYIVENLKEKTKKSRLLREFIEKQLEEVSNKLKSSEEALARFKEIEVPSGVGLALQDRLAELEAKHQTLVQQYTLLHPDVKKIEEQITQLKEQLKSLPQKELEYNRLTRDAEINASLYRDLKNKLGAARIAEAEQIEDVALVDRAVAPTSPVSPNKPFNYLLGIVVGLMLGLAGTFVLEQLDTSIGTVENVESYIELPILGVIPFSPLEEKKRFLFSFYPIQKDRLSAIKNRLIIYPSIQSSVIEAYRMLDTNLCSTFEEKTLPKIIVITSTAPREGKTIISANLAVVMAQRGMRTLIIDADLRRPVLYRLFGLKRDPGLSEILSGTHKLKDALRGFTDLFLGLKQEEDFCKTPGLNNLKFITPGHLPNNPVGLFTSERMSILMEELRKDFDIVIFDSPPILPVSDVSIFSPKADAVIMVYQVGKTSRSALQRSKKQLESVGAKLKGIVLNCLNPQVEMNRSYYYYRHYRYYGKKEEKDV